jgi:hypothetical protein
VIERTVASAESNMRSLAGDLSPDAAAIRSAKRAEFHSLGLVLGYSYAGSPIVRKSDDNTDDTDTDDVTRYTPSTTPGARLPHAWLPDGTSLYDRLGPGFTLLGPAHPGVAALLDRARRRRMPLSTLTAPSSYPWRAEFLLVRPDQHIAWRADDPADIDVDAAVGG